MTRSGDGTPDAPGGTPGAHPTLAGIDAQRLVLEIAHDMRSPLGAILMLTERLQAEAGPQLAPHQQRQLQLIHSATFGLAALVGDVLELARGGRALVEAVPEPLGLPALVDGVLAVLRPLAEERGLHLGASVAVDDRARLGHRTALERVLLNLATNAIKFTNTGSVDILVAAGPGARVDFAVRDTGPGIPDGVARTLFEAFRPGPAHGDLAFSSAGLGLSICRTLVEAMGARLTVASQPGQGTCFAFGLDLPALGTASDAAR